MPDLYIYIYACTYTYWAWPFFGLLQGGVATQCIQIELVDLKRRPSGLQHAGVPESRCSGNDRSLEFWCLGEAVFYILYYSIHIYYKHIERERERERDQLYSAGSFSTGLGHRLDSLVHLLCNFGRDPGAWRDSSRSVHLAINFANLASKPLVTPAAWIWHLDLRRASVLKMAETGSCAFSSTGQMSFCYISFII